MAYIPLSPHIIYKKISAGREEIFLELLKKNIHMNRRKSKAVSQLTMDDDFNVPDNKLDVSRIIQRKGEIKVDDVQVNADHVKAFGTLEIKILYIADAQNKMVHSLECKIPFEENINLDGVESGDNIRLKWDIEDLSSNLINSRKLSIKAIVTFNVSVEELYDAESTVGLADMGEISTKSQGIEAMQIVVNKKDTLRVKDEITLSSNKPNIHEILWESIQLRGSDIRVEDAYINVKGELFIFILYAGDDENNTMQWVESALPFQGRIDCPECNSELISNIEVTIQNADLEVRPDYDGEERIVQVDVVLELDIKLYEEEHIELLKDVYMPSRELIPVRRTEIFESLLVKNLSKCRANERVRIEYNQAKILQICHSHGEVKIDDIAIVENGIQVEGVVNVEILYVTSDDSMPFYSMISMVPFNHTIEAKGINNDSIYYMQTDLEQLSTTMIDSGEIEVKVTINLNALVVQKQSEDIIIQIDEEELDLMKLQELPGMVGYVVQANDSLWDIAKQFYTTIEQIKTINDLTSDEIRAGDRLIIMKSVENV